MNRLEKLALDSSLEFYKPGTTGFDSAQEFFIKGYVQAIQDCSLTWEDMKTISEFKYDVTYDEIKNKKYLSEEEFFKEVLKRFNETKNMTDTELNKKILDYFESRKLDGYGKGFFDLDAVAMKGEVSDAAKYFYNLGKQETQLTWEDMRLAFHVVNEAIDNCEGKTKKEIFEDALRLFNKEKYGNNS